MNEPTFPLDSDAMRLIAEIGFMGAQSSQLAAARALFEALGVLRPESTLPSIGMAMVHLAADRPEDAVRVLRETGLKLHPGDAEVMAFLGLALHAAGRRAESEKILLTVLEQEGSGSAPCARMAKKLLAIDAGGGDPARLMPRWSELAQKGDKPAAAR